MPVEIICGDALSVLAGLPAASVHCCITSPPYYGLRKYSDSPLEIGTEATPAEYVAHLTEVFRGVWRVLRDDGTCWVVIGDSYNAAGRVGHGTRQGYKQGTNRASAAGQDRGRANARDLKEKDLIGIPWRVAFALQDDGWTLRSAITWCKDNPMPESVTDRPTSATEMIFMLAKKPAYYYDALAIAEPVSAAPGRYSWEERKERGEATRRGLAPTPMRHSGGFSQAATRNKRNWWRVTGDPLDEPHYAAFPEALVTPMVLAATSEAGCCAACLAPYRRVVERYRTHNGERAEELGAWRSTSRARPDSAQGDGHWRYARVAEDRGWQAGCSCHAGPPLPCRVMDIFCGSGTTGLVAKKLGRDFTGIDLNESYVRLSEKRIARVPEPLFSAAVLADEGAAAR